MKKTILIVMILLTGCSTMFEVETCENKTITINNTIINETIKIIPCNLTCKECPVYNKSREFELIRRISFLEGQTDKYFNDSECNWELNRTEKRLEDCEDELCDEWNSSWC